MLVGDNLASRIMAILLGGVIALAILIGLVMAWPRPSDRGEGLFQLPVPEETAAIVQALEASSPDARPLVLRALNTSAASVHIEPSFPPLPPGLRRAQEMEWMFSRYSSLLGGRSFRVDLRAGPFSTIFPFGGGGRASVRLSVALKDGSVLVIERQPPVLIRSYIARLAVIAGLTAMVLIASLALAIRQTAGPVGRLARAARIFSIDVKAPDLPLKGPKELRELSSAFNEMQHRIQSLVEDRTRMLAAVAHDLRTYLTRLRLRAEFIPQEDQRRRAVEDIDEMALLMDDTLLFAEQTVRSDHLIAIELTGELASFVEARQEFSSPVSLDLEGHTKPGIFILCSLTDFRRMLTNLVDNAVRYGGSATVRLQEHDGRVEVLVDDEGPGAPAEELARLMKPFERMDGSRGRATGGAGLGLTIVKTLAERCGGEVRVENRLPRGLRASISFPKTPDPASRIAVL